MHLKKVVGAKKYSFQDRESGRQVEGVNVFFMQNAATSDEVGQIPQKVSLPYGSWEKVSKIAFPSECELITEDTFTSRGIKTKAVDLNPLTK